VFLVPRLGPDSEIIRAVADSPGGPFVHAQTVIAPFAHNPTIRKMPDGRFVLYMIGGTPSAHIVNCTNGTQSSGARDADAAAGEPGRLSAGDGPFGSSIRASVADSVYGPWSAPSEVMFLNRSAALHGGWTNPSPHFNADGSLTLAFQAQGNRSKQAAHHALVGIATATGWAGPFAYVTGLPVTAEALDCVAG
jgi:hypothetical protein